MHKMKITLIKNYGGVFIIWDRMFRTYKEEEDHKEAPIYGIRGSINTFNPIWANLHIYVKMLKDIWYTKLERKILCALCKNRLAA